MMSVRVLAVAVVALLLSVVGDALIVESEFCDTQRCNVETRGVWAVWWDKAQNHAADADHVLQQLDGVWQDCMGRLKMKKSDRVASVSYVNVYLAHDGDATGRSGQGVGTDKFRRPYITYPGRPDEQSLLHEGFHVCQYDSPSPGFAYGGNSGWYIEASANWYAATRTAGKDRAFVEADAIAALPHLPMWHSRYFNYEQGEPGNWQRYVHQYGKHALMYYMTEHGGVSESVMSAGFGAGTQLYPQQYFKQEIGLDRLRTVFADWTARTVFWEYLTAGQVSTLRNELQQYGDAADIHRYIGEYGSSGTGGWVRPSSTYVTRGWSFNVYKMQVGGASGYRFRVEGDASGSEGRAAAFQARVLVRKNGQNTYHAVRIPDGRAGELVLPGLQDCEVYLVVSAVPDWFQGFEHYSYRALIERASGPAPPTPPTPPRPTPQPPRPTPQPARATPLPAPASGAGLTLEVYKSQSMRDFPDYGSARPVLRTTSDVVDFGDAAWGALGFKDNFASRHTGLLQVDVSGRHTLYLTSDDGSQLYVDGRMRINNGGRHGRRTRTRSVYLSRGTHRIDVRFFENYGGAILKLEWRKPGGRREVVPKSNLRPM